MDSKIRTLIAELKMGLKTIYGHRLKGVFLFGSDLSLKYSVSICKVYLRERDWLGRESPFLANVREEAIAA